MSEEMKSIIYNNGEVEKFTEENHQYCTSRQIEGGIPVPWSQESVRGEPMPYEGFLRYLIKEDYAEMRQIYVAERARKKGIGRKLFNFMEEELKNKGIDTIYVSAYFGLDGIQANDFYHFLVACGYEYKHKATGESLGTNSYDWVKKI